MQLRNNFDLLHQSILWVPESIRKTFILRWVALVIIKITIPKNISNIYYSITYYTIFVSFPGLLYKIPQT